MSKHLYCKSRSSGLHDEHVLIPLEFKRKREAPEGAGHLTSGKKHNVRRHLTESSAPQVQCTHLGIQRNMGAYDKLNQSQLN